MEKKRIDEFAELAMTHIGELRDCLGRLQTYQMDRARKVARWVYMQFVNRQTLPDQPWAGEQPAPVLRGFGSPEMYAAWQYGGGKFRTRVVAGIVATIREWNEKTSK